MSDITKHEGFDYEHPELRGLLDTSVGVAFAGKEFTREWINEFDKLFKARNDRGLCLYAIGG
jgi:hypothetical protein